MIIRFLPSGFSGLIKRRSWKIRIL
jgi:hypothetical protein